MDHVFLLEGVTTVVPAVLRAHYTSVGADVKLSLLPRTAMHIEMYLSVFYIYIYLFISVSGVYYVRFLSPLQNSISSGVFKRFAKLSESSDLLSYLRDSGL